MFLVIIYDLLHRVLQKTKPLLKENMVQKKVSFELLT